MNEEKNVFKNSLFSVITSCIAFLISLLTFYYFCCDLNLKNRPYLHIETEIPFPWKYSDPETNTLTHEKMPVYVKLGNKGAIPASNLKINWYIATDKGRVKDPSAFYVQEFGKDLRYKTIFPDQVIDLANYKPDIPFESQKIYINVVVTYEGTNRTFPFFGDYVQYWYLMKTEYKYSYHVDGKPIVTPAYYETDWDRNQNSEAPAVEPSNKEIPSKSNRLLLPFPVSWLLHVKLFWFAFWPSLLAVILTLVIDRMRMPRLKIYPESDMVVKTYSDMGTWRFIHFIVINERMPLVFRWLPRQVAQNCAANLEFFDATNKSMFKMRGRWVNTVEIPHVAPDSCTERVLFPDPISISSSEKESLDCIAQKEGEPVAYGWNNEAYMNNRKTLRCKLEKGEYKVKIRIITQNGVSIVDTFKLCVDQNFKLTKLIKKKG